MEHHALRQSCVRVTRNDDINYDMILTLPGAKDYYREAMISVANTAEYKLCPAYGTMFSDLDVSNYMRLKKIGPPPEPYETWIQKRDITWLHLPPRLFDILGSHRTLFFKQPVPLSKKHNIVTVQLKSTPMPSQNINEQGIYGQARFFTLKSLQRRRKSLAAPASSKITITTSDVMTQTDFRDSETQTLPWAYECVVPAGRELELSALTWFSWEDNYPPGIREVDIIERARQRRAWEQIFPAVKHIKTGVTRKVLAGAMELNDTSFEEDDIERKALLRLELTRRMQGRLRELQEEQLEHRLQRFLSAKRDIGEEKIKYQKKQHKRAIRKLNLMQKKINKKFHKWDIVSLHEDRTSDLYAPQTRFGECPSRRHEEIDIQCRFLKRFRGLEILEKQASKSPLSRAPAFDYNKASKPKRGVELCVRETSWSEEGLKKLHANLKVIRSKRREPAEVRDLQIRQPRPRKISDTSGPEAVPDAEEDMYQACVFLSKTIKGRAIQSLFISALGTSSAASQTET